jgi:Ca-activated chloride channel family protein
MRMASKLVGALGLLILAGAPGCKKEASGTSYAMQAPSMAYADAGAVGAAEDPGTFNAEDYNHIVENDFVAVADDPRSTFSIDVDTASYANTRRFLHSGSLPPADAVRIEEFVNYFEYDYPSASNDAPFSVVSEVAACPWNAEHKLVHLGIQGQTIERDTIPDRNLVFLVDVSGSMGADDKLPLLKHGLMMLADQLRQNDHVSIVVYAGASGVVLEPTSDKTKIKRALSRLRSGGSTAGAAGLELAYQVAQRHFVQDGINRVILASDGDFNVGPSSQGELLDMIEDKRETGVFLSVLGFGTGNLNDAMMEQIADHGNGSYMYIDSEREARRVLVQQADSMLVAIAKDVKLQVEFNPAQVEGYRLIGYENRVLAHEDFNDDTKDAGEIGAGHSVTALYEVIPAGAGELSPSVDPLEYQDEGSPSAASNSNDLMTVKIRYKAPDGDTSSKLSFPVADADRSAEGSSDNFRFSASVAAFGMLLRNSSHKGDADWELVANLAQDARGSDRDGSRAEYMQLVDMAKRLAR